MPQWMLRLCKKRTIRVMALQLNNVQVIYEIIVYQIDQMSDCRLLVVSGFISVQYIERCVLHFNYEKLREKIRLRTVFNIYLVPTT
jgi:hypothetical protein